MTDLSIAMMPSPTPGNSLAAEAAPVVVRPSRDEDLGAMLDIYRRHIARGVEPAFAHDPEAPQPDDIKRRRRNMRKHRLPHLVADRNGSVVGYAYAMVFRKKAGLSLHGEALDLCAGDVPLDLCLSCHSPFRRMEKRDALIDRRDVKFVGNGMARIIGSVFALGHHDLLMMHVLVGDLLEQMMDAV